MSAIDFNLLRRTAIECQIRPFGVSDQRVLARFLETPREIFAPQGREYLAYSDIELLHPLEGGKGARAMLEPLVLARLLQAADIKPTDAVLDVGGATGYTAALAAGLATSVVALESDAALSRRAAENFHTLALGNIETICAPLADGAPAKAPFDVILVNGAAEQGLDKLIAQLAQGGRLLVQRPQAAGLAEVVVYRKDGEAVSSRALLEAAGRLLPEFAATPAFSF